MNFMNKLEKKLGRYAIQNLSLVLIICYGFGYAIQIVNYGFLNYLTLNPYLVLRGQVWRLLTWILVPPTGFNIVFYDFIPVLLLLDWDDAGTYLGVFSLQSVFVWGLFLYCSGQFCITGLLLYPVWSTDCHDRSNVLFYGRDRVSVCFFQHLLCKSFHFSCICSDIS